MSQLREFLEDELENRLSAGGEETDYAQEAREALDSLSALETLLASAESLCAAIRLNCPDDPIADNGMTVWDGLQDDALTLGRRIAKSFDRVFGYDPSLCGYNGTAHQCERGYCKQLETCRAFGPEFYDQPAKETPNV